MRQAFFLQSLLRWALSLEENDNKKGQCCLVEINHVLLVSAQGMPHNISSDKIICQAAMLQLIQRLIYRVCIFVGNA